MKKKLADVIKMVQLQSISQDQLCDWSLSKSHLMKRLKRNRMRDENKIRSLQEEKKTYESISQKQTDLYITPASLKEREM